MSDETPGQDEDLLEVVNAPPVEQDPKCWMCPTPLREAHALDEHGDLVPTLAEDPYWEGFDGVRYLFCGNDCRHEFVCANAEARHFEDAAYGDGD